MPTAATDERIADLFTDETRDKLRKLAAEGVPLLDAVRDFCDQARVGLARDVERPSTLRCAIDDEHPELLDVLTRLTVAAARAAGIELP